MNGHSLDSIDNPSEEFFEPPSFDEEKERRAGFYEDHENPTQEEQVLSWLTNVGTLTQRKANITLSVGRLSARIYNLIHRDGHPISKRMITVKNQFGKKCSVAEYYLEEDK